MQHNIPGVSIGWKKSANISIYHFVDKSGKNYPTDLLDGNTLLAHSSWSECEVSHFPASGSQYLNGSSVIPTVAEPRVGSLPGSAQSRLEIDRDGWRVMSSYFGILILLLAAPARPPD